MKTKNTDIPEKRIKRTTITDVARSLGVSVSTVSHALSGNRTISPEMKERVHKAIKEMDYHPNISAQRLAGGKTMNIGIIGGSFGGEYTPCCFNELSNNAAAHGYSTIVGVTLGSEKRGQEYLDRFCNGGADGIITACGDISEQQIAKIAATGYPIVVMPDRHIKGYPCCSLVSRSYDKLFRKLCEHLYSIGHRTFGFLCGTEAAHYKRTRVVREFMEEHNLDPERNPMIGDLLEVESAQTAAMQMLSTNKDITAMICHNDTFAFGAILAAREIGLRIPEDLSITGFDDVLASRLVYPQLTTVRMPLERTAQVIINRLVEWMGGKKPTRSITLQAEIIYRDSIAPPKAATKL